MNQMNPEVTIDPTIDSKKSDYQRADSSTTQLQQIDLARPKYGKMKILVSNRFFSISLGPKYYVFVLTLLFMLVAQIMLCTFTYNHIQKKYVNVLTVLLSIIHIGSYILVSLSNPGIVLPNSQIVSTLSNDQKNNFCHKCGAQKKQKTRHCHQCDVCIQGYDHHCGWISKCVGKRNLYQFYFFVALTPIYIVIFVFLMVICFIKVQTTNGTHSIRFFG